MQQLTVNVFAETGLRGANHGFVTTSDGIVLIDTPHKPSDALRLKAEIERRGPLRYIINTEPHGDHWTGNAFFNVPVVAQQGVRSRILGTDLAAHVARVASFGPEEPKLLENYNPNAPVITFQREMTKDECLANLTAMTDRYPMDVGQDGMAPHVMRLNVANLYDYLTSAGIHKHS